MSFFILYSKQNYRCCWLDLGSSGKIRGDLGVVVVVADGGFVDGGLGRGVVVFGFGLGVAGRVVAGGGVVRSWEGKGRERWRVGTLFTYVYIDVVWVEGGAGLDSYRLVFDGGLAGSIDVG